MHGVLSTCGSVSQENEASAGAPNGAAGRSKAAQLWDETPALCYICHSCALACIGVNAYGEGSILQTWQYSS